MDVTSAVLLIQQYIDTGQIKADIKKNKHIL